MKTRNFGLDLLRATAIIFVLINHVFNYFIAFPKSTLIGDILGILGVELFFVLSGFLIGGIVLREFGEGIHAHTVKRFYIRRWFRTLPLYYVLLITFVGSAAFATQQFDPHLLHFVFLQNFSHEALNFFGVSWSLAIEEWFYFLLPILLFFAYKIKLFKGKILYFLLLFIIFVLLARFAYVFFFQPGFDDMRKHIFFRFDSLIIGVLMAGVKLQRSTWYSLFQKPWFIILPLAIIAGLAYQFWKYFPFGVLETSLFARVAAFPLLSISIALLIPFLEKNTFVNHFLGKIKAISVPITWISVLSYSLYLIHLPMFDLVKGNLLDKMPLEYMAPIALIAAFLASYVLYRCVEKPFMRLREKYS
ncbi:MAG: acyltransferase [Patescibacteria group bacterium]